MGLSSPNHIQRHAHRLPGRRPTRPCSISEVPGPAPKFSCRASRQHGSGQGLRGKRGTQNLLDDAVEGEAKHWPSFKEAIQARADSHDTTWLFEGGRSLAEFFARQIKDETGSKSSRKQAFKREISITESNHVSTSVDAYTEESRTTWFEDKDLGTGLLCCCRSTRIASRHWAQVLATSRSSGLKIKPR